MDLGSLAATCAAACCRAFCGLYVQRVTLLECIENGSVPYNPGRVSYVQWLKWRRVTGTRPLRKRDGVFTSFEEEAALWRSVMNFLHDATEDDDDEEEEEGEEEEEPPEDDPFAVEVAKRKVRS